MSLHSLLNPKRVRFLVLNIVGKLVRHARETMLRFGSALGRSLAGGCRVAVA